MNRLNRLLKQSQVCYWCGSPVKVYKSQPYTQLPSNTATVDHIYPTNHPMRLSYRKAKTESPCVLACLRCNNERGDRSFSKQKLIALQRYPYNTPNAKAIALEKLQAAGAKPSFGKPKLPKIRLLRDRKPRMKGFKR